MTARYVGQLPGGESCDSATTEIVLFNHIPKTAGSTMKHVIWRAFGGGSKVFMSTIPGTHSDRIAELRVLLDQPHPPVSAIIAHTGFGLHERLPSRHAYRMFTVLRDPVERTISQYFYEQQRGKLSNEVSLTEFVQLDRARNVQTAFLGGLHVREHLDGLVMRKDLLTQTLLGRAIENLRTHDAVGLTERFDESLLLLKQTYRWSSARMLYRRENIGQLRPDRPIFTPAEIEAVRGHNELDLALYEATTDLFEAQLRERVPALERRLTVFGRVNKLYATCYPAAYPPARAIVHVARRARRFASRPKRTAGQSLR